MAALAKGAKTLLIDTPGKVMENTGKMVQHVTQGVENLGKTGEYATEGVAAAAETAKELLKSTAALSSVLKAQIDKKKVASEGRLAVMTEEQKAKTAEAEKKADEKVKQAQSEMEKNKLKLQSEMRSLNDPAVIAELEKALRTTQLVAQKTAEMEARNKLEKLASTDNAIKIKLNRIRKQAKSTEIKNLKCQQIGFEKILLPTTKFRLCNYAPLPFFKNDYYCIDTLTIGKNLIKVNVKFGILPTGPVAEPKPVAEPEPEQEPEPDAPEQKPEPDAPETAVQAEQEPEPDAPETAEPAEHVTGGNNPSGEKQWYYQFLLDDKLEIIDNEKLFEAFSNDYEPGTPLLIGDLNVDSVSFAHSGKYDYTDYTKEFNRIIPKGGKRTRKAKKNRTVKKNKKKKTRKI